MGGETGQGEEEDNRENRYSYKNLSQKIIKVILKRMKNKYKQRHTHNEISTHDQLRLGRLCQRLMLSS